MSFIIKDDCVLVKCNKIWDKIEKTFNSKFHSMPEKYIKAEVREFNGVIKTSFWGDKLPKEGVDHTCIECITVDYVLRMGKKNYPQLYLEECRFRIKETKMPEFIDAKLESDSSSDSE